MLHTINIRSINIQNIQKDSFIIHINILFITETYILLNYVLFINNLLFYVCVCVYYMYATCI